MPGGREVQLLFGRQEATLRLPRGVHVLQGVDPPPLPDPRQAVLAALAHPVGVEPLAALLRRRRPRRVAITVSDITRPVPNRELLLPLLEVMGQAGVADRDVT